MEFYIKSNKYFFFEASICRNGLIKIIVELKCNQNICGRTSLNFKNIHELYTNNSSITKESNVIYYRFEKWDEINKEKGKIKIMRNNINDFLI